MNGQREDIGNTTDISDESNSVRGNCISVENYCCNEETVKINSYPKENNEEFVNNSRSSTRSIFFGPALIFISLLVLKAFSKRVEE